jgi:O-antigen ligase
MSSLARAALPSGARVGRGAAVLLLVAFAAASGVGLGRAPVIIGEGKTALLMPALALGALALCFGYVRPLPVLCAGMALVSFARIQPLTPADGAIAICMLLTLVGPLRFRPSMPAGPAVALSLFTLGTVLSMTEAQATGTAISFEGHTIFFVFLAIWLTSALRTNGWTREAVRWYILGAAVTAALGVLAWVIHFPASDLFVYPNGKRIQGLYLDPNAFGPYLVPAAVICLEDLMRPRLLRWPAPLVLLTFTTLLLGVVLTFSRAATANLALACLVVVFVYAMRTNRRKALVRGLAILAACTVCAAGALVQTGALSILQDRAQTQGYDSQRFSNQGQAVDMGATRLLGYGPGAVQTELSLNTHSTFVWSLFENGILGFAALLLLVLSTAVTAWRSALRDHAREGLGAAALLGCWLGLSFNGLVVDTYHYPILWLLAALVWVVASAPSSSARDMVEGSGRESAPATKRRLYAHAD